MDQDRAPVEHLEERVIELVARHQHLQPGQVTIDSKFADLKIDSLDGMELVFEFEEAFGISIPDDVAREMTGVSDAVAALRQELTSPPPAEAPEPGTPSTPAS